MTEAKFLPRNSQMGSGKDSDKVRDKVFLGTPSCWTRQAVRTRVNIEHF